MPKQILFATDFSGAAERAFSHLYDLLEPQKTRVTLLHVYHFSGPMIDKVYEHLDSEIFKEIETQIRNQALAALNKLKSELGQTPATIETLCLRGEIAPMIIKTAGHQNSDLILIGSRGLGAFSSLLLGSTSRYVLHHSPCPVMIIPGTASLKRMLLVD